MLLTRPPGKIKRQTIALLGGLCFFFSAIEYMIPKPLPFIRLGLANFPLLLALDLMPFSSFMILAGLKVTGQALISGTLFSYVFLFSMGGTFASALFMYALRRGLGKERIGFIGVSVAGAFASNGVTLVLARFFVFGAGIIYAAAPVLALGIITGALLGAASEHFIRNSLWYAQAENSEFKTSPLAYNHTSIQKASTRREEFCQSFFNSNELAAAGLCMMLSLLLNPNTYARIVQFLFFFFLAWLSGKRNKLLITLSVMLGIIFFNLLVPYGEVLFSIGPFPVTSGALFAGIRRAVTLEGLFMLSRFSVRKDLALPGGFGEIASESLRIFSNLAGEKKIFIRNNWVQHLDELLLAYSEKESAGINVADNGKDKAPGRFPQPGGREKTARPGARIILVTAVILAWLPLLIKA